MPLSSALPLDQHERPGSTPTSRSSGGRDAVVVRVTHTPLDFVTSNVISNEKQGTAWARTLVVPSCAHGAASGCPPRRPCSRRSRDSRRPPSNPGRTRAGLAQAARPALLRASAHRGRRGKGPGLAGRSATQRHGRGAGVVAAPRRDVPGDVKPIASSGPAMLGWWKVR